jgi:putative ABC transport system permease protein
VTVTPLLDVVVGDVKPALFVLLAASVLVLVIAGTNVAHLQLVRAAGRERELAVRTAIGASRARIVRQLVTEGIVLSAAGAAAGLAVTRGLVRLLIALAPPSLPRIATVTVDGRVLLFALGATLLTGIAFALAPAIRGTRFDLGDSLKSGGRGSADRSGRSVLRRLLIVSEFSMAMVLLAAAALVVRSFLGLLAVDSGFDPRNVSAVEVSVTGTGSAAGPRRAQFFQQVVAGVRALPGVEAASAINHLPLVGDVWRFGFAIEGRAPVRREDRPSATFRVVLPGYFETMRIARVGGRDFTDRDTRDAPPVVIVNELMARRHWPGRSPIGERLATGDLDHPTWSTVVGVVATVKQTTWRAAADEEMYFPYLQTRLYLESTRSFASYLSLVARTAPGMPPPYAGIEAAARALEPGAVVSNPTTVERAIAGEFVAPRFYMLLVGVFATVAVVLAAVGIYGVMSHAVASRTREIGVRVALGASAREIVSLVTSSGLRLAIVGSLVGVAGAVASARYLQTLLFGVEPTDPATLAAVALALVGVACAACYIPARRALAVDPMTAVRSE